MYSFEMTQDVAMEFYRRAEYLGLKTEAERTELLIAMAQEGLIKRVTKTNRTKEQYVEDLAKNFNVVDLTSKDHKCGPECFDPEGTLDAVWTRDSETGDRVLIDRKTNQIIMRETNHD